MQLLKAATQNTILPQHCYSYGTRHAGHWLAKAPSNYQSQPQSQQPRCSTEQNMRQSASQLPSSLKTHQLSCSTLSNTPPKIYTSSTLVCGTSSPALASSFHQSFNSSSPWHSAVCLHAQICMLRSLLARTTSSAS